MTSDARQDLLALIGLPVHAVVPAAGAGVRFGGGLAKQFRNLAGRPLLAWSVDCLFRAGVESLTIAVPDETYAAPPDWLLADGRVGLVAGGGTRQASVALALAASPAGARDLVAVHDGARPALASEDLEAVCAAAAGADVDGAILGRSLADTLKRLDGRRIAQTVDRADLFRAETPQVFRREVLERALRVAGEVCFVGTDEASLVERLPGSRILAVEATHANPKVTTPSDLPLVEALLATLGDPDREREWR